MHRPLGTKGSIQISLPMMAWDLQEYVGCEVSEEEGGAQREMMRQAWKGHVIHGSWMFFDDFRKLKLENRHFYAGFNIS